MPRKTEEKPKRKRVPKPTKPVTALSMRQWETVQRYCREHSMEPTRSAVDKALRAALGLTAKAEVDPNIITSALETCCPRLTTENHP